MIIHPVTTFDERKEIHVATQQDKHFAIAPTHYWRNRAGQVSGYFSCGVIPVIHFWSSTQSSAMASYRAIRQGEKVVREHGIKAGFVACQSSSPFYPVMQAHFGYEPVVKDTTLFAFNLA